MVLKFDKHGSLHSHGVPLKSDRSDDDDNEDLIMSHNIQRIYL